MTTRATSGGYEIYQDGTDLLVSMKGRIVLEDLTMLKQNILPRITRGIENVYIDLKQIDYVDSAGLGLLIGFKMQSKSHGANISLMDPNKNVAEVLSISRIDGIFEIISGRDALEVRDRLASPANLQPGNENGTDAAIGTGGHLPTVSAEGKLESDENEQNREAVEEQCRNAVEAMRQGDYERSIQCYKTALELDPDYLPALNNLAIVYEKQPTWHPQAIETWNHVLEVSRARNDVKHMDRAQRHLADLKG